MSVVARMSALIFVLLFVASIANASPLSPGQVEVVDGDTIRISAAELRAQAFSR